MGGKYKAYPEYQDSGVEWVGKIPTGWNIIRLKYVSELKGKKVSGKSHLRYVGMENIESQTGRHITTTEPDDLGVSDEFAEGDVLFGKLRPYLAKSWLATFSGICSSEFLVLRSRKTSPAFLNYYTLIEEFINQVNGSTYGSKMPRASWDFISLMDVPTPDYEQSQKIARFLDHETEKIDLLIEKQQELIALLKEKRQAVISHAVTKGLNPQAPLKDSGIEWLGQVPEHWDIWKLKHSCSEIFLGLTSKVDYVEEGGIPLVRALNITGGTLNLKGARNISVQQHKQLTKYRQAKLGDVLLSKSGTIGTAALVQIDADFSIYESIFALRGKLEILDPRFLLLFIQSDIAKGQYARGSVGMGVHHLNMPDIEEVRIGIPSLSEQLEIVDFVTTKMGSYDRLVETAETKIALLQERRTALISAAVTGKIDVRDWEPPQH